MSTEPEVREPIRAVLAVLDSAAGTTALVADSLAEWVHDACEPVEDLPVVAPAVRTLDATAVSYTHLDVYKRQFVSCARRVGSPARTISRRISPTVSVAWVSPSVPSR